MMELHCTTPSYVIFLISPLMFVIMVTTSAGVIPLDHEERIMQKACTSTKVACDPGWTCQMGILVFPSENNLDCESYNKDCLPDNRLDTRTMEVYCAREARRPKELREGYDLTALLERIQGRGRRATCVEWCSLPTDCAAGEVCISNGCGHQCAKRPTSG